MTIQELRKLGEEATAGEWSVYDDGVTIDGGDTRQFARVMLGDPNRDADAAFIATARNKWELLLDVAEAAEALIAQPLDVRIVKEDEPSMDAFSAKRDAVVLALRALETTK